MKTPILSICIPTYNSADIIYNNALDILSVKSEKFQLVISDNHSEDNTLEKLYQIKDPRLKVLTLDKNMGSTYNFAHVYKNSDGQYVMICMDKDIVVSDQIEKAIEILEKNDINFGYFELNSKNNNANKNICLIKKCKDCILKFPYLSMHPSGTFFKRKIIQNSLSDDYLAKEENVGGFIFDFLLAEASLWRNGAIINIPFIKTISPPFSGKKHSYTYSPVKKNVYFEPDERYKILIKYINHIKRLNLDNKTKQKVIFKTVCNTFYFSTIFYKEVLTQKNICEWYNVEPRVLSEEELKQISLDFINKILKSNFLESGIDEFKLINKIFKKLKFGIFQRIYYYMKLKKNGNCLCQF